MIRAAIVRFNFAATLFLLEHALVKLVNDRNSKSVFTNITLYSSILPAMQEKFGRPYALLSSAVRRVTKVS